MAKSYSILILILAITHIGMALPLSDIDNEISDNDLEEAYIQYSDEYDNVNPQETLYSTDIYEDAAVQEEPYLNFEEANFDEDQAIAEYADETGNDAYIMSKKLDLKEIKKKEQELNKMMRKTKRMDKDAALLLKRAHYVKGKKSPNANIEADKRAAAKARRHKKDIKKAAKKVLRKIEELYKKRNKMIKPQY